jgi:hypothetical protein
MKSSQSTKKRKIKESSGGGAQQFLVWHGEKIVVGIVIVLALWFAMKGLGYSTVSWQPSELETIADEARRAIEGSTRSAEDEDISPFDYAAYAEQIKEPIPAEPYRNPRGAEWNPSLTPRAQSAPPQESAPSPEE